MAYNQNKNPFQSKSPLNHNLRDKRTGTNFTHFHDPNNQSNIYSSDQKVISGNSKFGTQSGRAKNLPYEKGGNMNFDVGQRLSEEDIARDYARQMSEMYNRGELVSGNFLADDLYKQNRKLSLKKGKLKLGSRGKRIGGVRDFNTGYADEVEGYDPNVGYVAPETQYTEDQIYDMMVQGGGLVSIMDGKIVAGNPNQVTTEGYDQANKIRYNNDDFRNQYEEGTEEDFNRRAERNNRPEPTQQQKDEAKEKIIAIRARKEQEKADEKLATQEKINKIKAARAAKAAEENRTIEERKALLQEKKEAILAARAAKSNSPVNNNSPLHQEQEIDPRTGEAIPGYDYVPGEEVITNRSEEVLDDNGNIIGYNDITDTTITNRGTMTPPSPPPPPPNNRPSFKEDCEGIVMNMGNFSKSGFYKCDIDPSPPITTPPAEIETPEDLSHSYDDLTTSTVFRPIEQTTPVETPEPEPRKSRFITGGASIYKKPVNWDLTLPQTGPKFDAWLRNLSLTGKKCGNCDYLNR